jgi:hypothetical protein
MLAHTMIQVIDFAATHHCVVLKLITSLFFVLLENIVIDHGCNGVGACSYIMGGALIFIGICFETISHII